MPLIIIKSDARAREKPCLRCGTSLRKITDARHCPKCGLSVWLSLSSNDALDWSNPPWLRKLALGVTIMAAAQFVGIAACAAYFIDQLQSLFALLLGVYLLAHHAGLLLVAWPERRYPDRVKAHRIAVWVVAPIAMLVGFSLIATAVRGHGVTFIPLLQGIFIASAIVTWVYLRPLARRIPSSFLARFAGYILLAPLLAFLKSFPIFAFLLVFNFFSFLDLLPLVYVPLCLFLFIRFALAFAKASRSAEKSWADETQLPTQTQPTKEPV